MTPQSPRDLGRNILWVGIAVKGKITKENCAVLIDAIFKQVGLSKAHNSATYDYPVNGKGGIGFTYIQPMTESFVAIDVWPKYRGAYILISSCKLFWIHNVVNIVKSFNLKVLEVKTEGLSLGS